MVGSGHGQGAGAGGGQAAGRGQPSRGPCAERRGWPIPISPSPICCCWSRAAIASCSVEGVGRLPPPRDHDRRRRRRGVRQERRSCSGSAIPADRRSSALRAERRRDGGAAAAPAAGLGRAPFLLRRPQERGAARGATAGTTRPRTSPRASSRRWSTAWSTAPRARLSKTRRAPPWSSPAASRPIRRSARALAELAASQWPAASSHRRSGCAPTMRR